MLPRLYFLFLTNFFLSSFFQFQISLSFSILFYQETVCLCSLFLSCPSPILSGRGKENRLFDLYLPFFFLFFFSLFCSMLWQFKTVFTASKRRQERLLFFSDIVFWHAKFLMLFSSPYNIRYCVTFYFLISTFSFSYKPSEIRICSLEMLRKTVLKFGESK